MTCFNGSIFFWLIGYISFWKVDLLVILVNAVALNVLVKSICRSRLVFFRSSLLQ